MPSLKSGCGIDYIECLFVSDDVDSSRESAIDGSPVRSVEAALHHLAQQQARGLRHALVVGVCDQPDLKRPLDSHFCIQRLLRAARQQFGDSFSLIADVGLSPYQADGHSVVLNGSGPDCIDVEASYAAAVAMGIAFIRSGADAVAPCLSLPEQTRLLRDALDAAGLSHGEVMPYAIKFSSSLYGPYRGAIGSALGCLRKPYQFDQSNASQAMAQFQEDLRDGASGVIVKPALPYLDLLAQAVSRTTAPVAVYHVSGEYMMAIQASASGLINLEDYFDEVHQAFQRCGARYVIGYAADHFLRWQQGRAAG